MSNETDPCRLYLVTPPRLDPAFGITAKAGPLIGSTSPLATEVDLTVDTGIAGEFVLQQSTK